MARTDSGFDDDRLLEIVRDHRDGISVRQIVREASIRRGDQPALRRSLRSMVERGELVRLARGRYGLPSRDVSVRGRLTLHPDGYGFVRADDGGPDVFVPPGGVGRARHGDEVAVLLHSDREAGRRSGRITRVLHPRGRRILGVLAQGQRVVPIERGAGTQLRLRTPPPRGTPEGAIVIADLGPAGRDGQADRATIERVLGLPGEPGVDEAIVVEKFSLPEEFPPEVLDDAARLAETTMGRLAREERTDFRDWSTVTIDGETAKDFDDAVSVRTLGGGKTRLAVHIADVSAFVPEGTLVDKEAESRATSVYFPGRVIPMLPPLLSDDLCSLVPGRDRPVQSVVMDFDQSGRRLRSRFARGWIRSRARLTYGQVADFLSGKKTAWIGKTIGEDLSLCGQLARRLRKRRMSRGGLDFDLPEPEILFDIDGAASGVVAGERNEAHRLIEEFMITANEAVAEHMHASGKPSIYRIHEPPDPLKLDALREAIVGLGYRLSRTTGPPNPSDLAEVVEEARDKPEERFIHTVVLRSLMQARYSASPEGHFGLASKRYTHFTSPIRRYPDLVVHRLIGRTGDGERDGITTERLDALSAHCSRREREAEAAEREVLARKILGLLEKRVGERHAGYITGVVPFGLFVQLVDIFAEGLLAVEALPDDTWTHDERTHRLLGVRSGQVFRLGDRVEVDVVRVDRVLQRVDFALAGTTRRADSATGARRARSRGSRSRSDSGGGTLTRRRRSGPPRRSR